MKKFLAVGVALGLWFPAVPLVAQTNQILQGTQVRLVLLTGLSTSVAREGDPFIATVAEPVYIGGQMVLPAGVKVHGQVGNIIRPKRFAMFRGQAAMNLYFRSIEVEHREYPVQMSILQIYDGGAEAEGKKRKDVRVEEGVYVESKRDVKGDVTAVGLATGGGTALGAVFSRVVRGLTLGLVGGVTYIVVKKGKEVELPTRTGFLVRLDTTLALPATTAAVPPYSPNPQ